MSDLGLARSESERDLSTSVRAEDTAVHYGKSGRPYVPDVVGTWHQDEPRFELRIVLDKETGIEATQSYMVPEGDHLIYGAMSVDRQQMLDAAVAFRGFNTRTQENEFLTQQVDPGKLLELEAARQVSLEPGMADKLARQVQAQEQKPALSLHR